MNGHDQDLAMPPPQKPSTHMIFLAGKAWETKNFFFFALSFEMINTSDVLNWMKKYVASYCKIWRMEDSHTDSRSAHALMHDDSTYYKLNVIQVRS